MIVTHRKKIREGLKKRGWEKEHIDSIDAIMEKGEKKLSPSLEILDRFLFWLAMGLALMGNIIILVAFLPLIIQLPVWLTLIIAVVIGGSYGLLMDSIIMNTSFTINHYFMASVLVLIIPTTMFLLILHITQDYLKMVGIFIKINPLLLVFIYVTSFIMPHLLRKKRESYELG